MNAHARSVGERNREILSLRDRGKPQDREGKWQERVADREGGRGM